MKLIYMYYCKRCKIIKFRKRHTDFSDTNCNDCNSRSFGLTKYELIKITDEDYEKLFGKK
jgi:hypothetical protein